MLIYNMKKIINLPIKLIFFSLYNHQLYLICSFVCLMVFNATFNNISVILWWSVLLVKETEGPGENHQPVEVTEKLNHVMLYTSP